MTVTQGTTKVYTWASILDDNTLSQAARTASMPFVQPHLALMPDAHLGKGSTVGSVVPTVGAIIPACVGVDIGCGMIAVRTQWDAEELRHVRTAGLARLRESIERAVPLSAGNYNTAVSDTAVPRIEALAKAADAAAFDPATYSPNWALQLGTLGSGNHFIEVTADEQDRVWLFLHSGSRGVGNRIASKHIKVAAEQARKWWLSLPDPDLAYLVEGTDEFWAYIRQMRWAQEFALLNRAEMMDRLIGCTAEYMGEDVEVAQEINCHHNFTEQEEHYGQRLWLTRKGAIKAGRGDYGLIPGSMGTASYVVVGRGNALSFNSSPHGAGRVYSRGQAKRTFTLEDLRARMAAAGVEWRDSDAFIDEIPDAYKDVEQVMRDAADLVAPLHTLRQLVNVKGD
jgi:tRNA-splicing ligase RtcB